MIVNRIKNVRSSKSSGRSHEDQVTLEALYAYKEKMVMSGDVTDESYIADMIAIEKAIEKIWNK